MNSANPTNVLVTTANRKPDGHAEVGSSDLQATTEAQMETVGRRSSNIGSTALDYHTAGWFFHKAARRWFWHSYLDKWTTTLMLLLGVWPRNWNILGFSDLADLTCHAAFNELKKHVGETKIWAHFFHIPSSVWASSSPGKSVCMHLSYLRKSRWQPRKVQLSLSAFGAQSCLHPHAHLLQLQRDSLALKENSSSIQMLIWQHWDMAY